MRLEGGQERGKCPSGGLPEKGEGVGKPTHPVVPRWYLADTWASVPEGVCVCATFLVLPPVTE